MNKITEIQLENGEKLYGPLEPRLILLNNQLCLVYFQSDDKTSFNLYLAMVDETTLSLKEPKKICTIQQDNVGIFKLESVINSGLVHITNSPDNSKTLIACNTSPNSVMTFVADNNLNLLKQTTVRTNSAGFDISSAVLTNDNLECLVMVSGQETKIICNSADGKKAEMKLNPTGNLAPYHTNASLSRDGKNIYIYSAASLSGEDDISCKGLLISQLDCSTLKLSKPLSYEFDSEFLERVSQKGGGTKHRKEYSMYDFTPSLMELDNGNLVILGCPQETSTSTTTSAPNMNNQTHLVSTTTSRVGPVIAFFPNKNGKSFEYVLVPRKSIMSKAASSGSGYLQMVQSPGISCSFSSFTASRMGDEILIIYNDNEKNLARREDEKLEESDSPNDLVLAEALIDKARKLQYRKQIGKNADGKYTYFLGNTVPTSSSSIVFPIAKEGSGFNARKIFFSNWCFLDVK